MPKAVKPKPFSFRRKPWPLMRMIVEVRAMTAEELKEQGWDRPCAVLVLHDGSKIYASADAEGNHPGVLFGTNEKTHLTILAREVL